MPFRHNASVRLGRAHIRDTHGYSDDPHGATAAEALKSVHPSSSVATAAVRSEAVHNSWTKASVIEIGLAGNAVVFAPMPSPSCSLKTLKPQREPATCGILVTSGRCRVRCSFVW